MFGSHAGNATLPRGWKRQEMLSLSSVIINCSGACLLVLFLLMVLLALQSLQMPPNLDFNDLFIIQLHYYWWTPMLMM